MLLNLTTHKSFPKLNSPAITCWKDKGPSFGNWDLAASEEPFNKEGSCLSIPNEDCYNISRNNEGINILTN